MGCLKRPCKTSHLHSSHYTPALTTISNSHFSWFNSAHQPTIYEKTTLVSPSEGQCKTQIYKNFFSQMYLTLNMQPKINRIHIPYLTITHFRTFYNFFGHLPVETVFSLGWQILVAVWFCAY